MIKIAVRSYWESIKKKWKELLGISTVPIIVFLFTTLISTGAITITGTSGSMQCAGSIEDPCYATINFTANEDIYIYPNSYDPWGRNVSLVDFDAPLKNWKIQRKWGSGWRDISDPCTGSWCGCYWCRANNTAKYAYAFRKGRDYTIRIVGYKQDKTQDVSFSFGTQTAKQTGARQITWSGITGADTTPPKYSNVQDDSGGSVTPGTIVNVSTYWEDIGNNLDYLNLYDNSSGSFIRQSVDSSPNNFNNSLESENLTFSGNENITRWIEVPKNSNVTKVELNLTGADGVSDAYDEIGGFSKPNPRGGLTFYNGYIYYPDDQSDNCPVTVHKIDAGTGNEVSTIEIACGNCGQERGGTPQVLDGLHFDGNHFYVVTPLNVARYNSDGTCDQILFQGTNYDTSLYYNQTHFFIGELFDGITIYTDEGTQVRNFAFAGRFPTGIWADDNYIYAMDVGEDDVYMYTHQGTLVKQLLNGEHSVGGDYMTGLAFNKTHSNPENKMWLLNFISNDIWEFERTVVKNPYIQTANSGGPTEWSYSGDFNQSVSPETADLNATLFNNYLDTCTEDSDGNCQFPLKFHSDTAGKLEASNINVRTSFLWYNTTIDTTGHGGQTIGWYQTANDTLGNENTSMSTDLNTFSVGTPDINYGLNILQFEFPCDVDTGTINGTPTGQDGTASLWTENNGSLSGDFQVQLTQTQGTDWTMWIANSSTGPWQKLTTSWKTFRYGVGSGVNVSNSVWFQATCQAGAITRPSPLDFQAVS